MKRRGQKGVKREFHSVLRIPLSNTTAAQSPSTRELWVAEAGLPEGVTLRGPGRLAVEFETMRRARSGREDRRGISELGWVGLEEVLFGRGVASGPSMLPLFRFVTPQSKPPGAASALAEPPEFVAMVTGSEEAFPG